MEEVVRIIVFEGQVPNKRIFEIFEIDRHSATTRSGNFPAFLQRALVQAVTAGHDVEIQHRVREEH